MKWLTTIFLSVFLICLITSCDIFRKNTAPSLNQKDYEYFAFKNVNIVPMTEETVLKNKTVLIKGRSIIAVDNTSEIEIPDNTLVIDGSGKYLMPGLADMHIHTTDAWQSMEWPVSPMDLFLAKGVTTIRDFGPKGDMTDYVLHWRDAITEGRIEGPNIYACGGVIFGPVDNPQNEVTSQKTKGFDFVKLYSYLSGDEFNTAISTAKNLGIYTAGHIPFQVGLDGVLDAGMNEIAHVEELAWEFVNYDRKKNLVGYPWIRYVAETGYMQFKEEFNLDPEKLNKKIGKEISELVQKLQSKRIPVDTTLAPDDVILQKLFHAKEFQADPINGYLPPRYMKRFQQGKEKHQVMFKGGEDYAPFKYEFDKILLRELKKQGVSLLLSTDAGGGGMGIVPGFSIHRELEILVESGFSPYEAIATGTVQASKVVEKMIGRDEFGTIQVGKRADLLLVKANPLVDVSNINNPLGVMAAGRWYDKKALQEKLKPGIPLTAVVRHIHEPDNKSYTHFEILVGPKFKGKLPGDVDEISIVGPQGKLAQGKGDFRYFPGVRGFWAKIPGSPKVGTYVFTVSCGDLKGMATNTQSIVRNINLPDTTTLLPVSGSVLETETVTFSWGEVNAPFPVYYRLEIFESQGSRMYSTGYIKDMLSHTISKDVLKPGNKYGWRIRVVDQPSWFSVQNRTQSNIQSFTMSKEI